MVRLREIPRTAAFAWSSGPAPPLLATGTKAGAVDADFSNETQLEIWDLGLDNREQGVELQPAGSIAVDSRFHDIAWSQPNEDHPRGIVAGALESGSLDLWDAEKLRTASEDSHLSRTSKHSGAIKCLQFNPFRHGLLATAGAKGELYITDLNNPSNPFRLGTSAARADDFEALDWNKKVPHILATGSSGGFVTVWDVKAKKENLTLNNYGRKAVSAVAWDPDVPTRLVTAIPNDQDPLILMWDLRNSNAPERILRAHDQGVLSLSWCPQDSDLLLSCGKDNRTICWNSRTGEALGEFPVVTNWTFETRWNPHNPSLLATASFDGKIGVHTIQNTNSTADQPASRTSQSLSGEDFFAKAQTQPQGSAFSLPKAPKWLERPVGVAFGFGGKLIKFGVAEAGSRSSKISISTFAIDPTIGSATEKFEEALQKGDLASICEAKIANANTEEEKADWTVIDTLISGNSRKKFVGYLGFSEEEASDKEDGAKSTQVNGSADTKDDAYFFDDTAAGDNFLNDLAATKGAKTNSPFQIYTGTESEADRNITRALMLGSFEKALDICLKEDRLSDAFMIAICGGQKCIDKAQAAYFRRRADGPNYLRLLASVVGKNLWDVVHNADLKDWKDVMATLCTFADESEFSDLCEALGDRLEESIQERTDSSTLRKDASFCYLAGSKLEKVVVNWAQELQENEHASLEQADNDSSFSVHAKSLQDFIEKVTVFREVTRYQDTDRQRPSDWKLAPLYAKYTEYADIVASHGQLKIAEKYLDLLPEQYPAAQVARNRVKEATRKAAPQAAQKQAAAPAATAQRGQRVVPAYQPTQPPSLPGQAPAPSPYAPISSAIPTPQAQSAYAPAGASQRGYTPIGYQQAQPGYQQPGPGIPAPQQYGLGYQQPQQTVPPPPRGFTSSPAVPPPSKATNASNWNDTPDFGTKPPTSRRGTPGLGASAITSPFANQPNTASASAPPPLASPYTAPQRATPPPPPPPPKGPPQAAPRVTSPLSGGSPQGFHTERPSSSAANTYAPPQPSSQLGPTPPQPTIPRGTSPYNPPPAAAPTSNRYAPAPSAQPKPSPSAGTPRQVAPPPNPYALQPSNPYAPPSASPYTQYSGMPQPGQAIGQPTPPPQGPPQAPPRATPSQGPPSTGPPRGPPQGSPPQRAAPDSRPSTAQSQRSTPAPEKHPAGDRSHIPASATPIYEILHADMQRVKARAPPTYKAHVVDAEKRLNILFDHLNNEDLLKSDTVQSMVELAQAVQGKQYEQAQVIITELQRDKMDEGTNWMVGVKRLIAMSKATPN